MDRSAPIARQRRHLQPGVSLSQQLIADARSLCRWLVLLGVCAVLGGACNAWACPVSQVLIKSHAFDRTSCRDLSPCLVSILMEYMASALLEEL